MSDRPGSDDFGSRIEAFRRELTAHCYRMTGSADDAEDLVQETYLRAWRAQEGFEGRSSLRVWLYRIATNACLNALAHSSRRVLPSGLGAPGEDPFAEPVLAGPDVRWLQPFPTDPADAMELRASVRLALIASLQVLTPQQRAVLILRDVLAFSAAETAQVLELTVAAVKSTLQRARSAVTSEPELAEPGDPRARAWLDGYMAAWERSDVQELTRVLQRDAVLEMTPSRTWFQGFDTCIAYMRQALGTPDTWRAVPVEANGQPAAGAYLRGADGVHRAFALSVLTPGRTGLARVTLFGVPVQPGLFERFGLPLTL